jgi:hypothetical protein
MSTDPRTTDDPQPGDFDDVVVTLDAAYVEHHVGDPTATLRILAGVEGEDALSARVAGRGERQGRRMTSWRNSCAMPNAQRRRRPRTDDIVVGEGSG